MRRERGFSLVEILITMLVMGILGGVVVSSLWYFFGMYSQADDYATSRQNIELVFQALGNQISNTSLGMPNNKGGEGTFADAFSNAGGEKPPIMGLMGARGAAWGGPVTLGSLDVAPLYKFQDQMAKRSYSGFYYGDVLFFAWAEATGIKVSGDHTGSFLSGETKDFLISPQASGGNGIENLLNLKDDGYPFKRIPIALSPGSGAKRGVSPRSWVVFPTLRVPMRIEGIRTTTGTVSGDSAPSEDNSLRVRLAPGGDELEGILGGFEEIHLVRTARVYLNKKLELIQEYFGDDYTAASYEHTDDVLATNIAGVYFRFDFENRLLTMYIAAYGNDPTPSPATGKPPYPSGWPAFAPPIPYKDASGGNIASRVSVHSVTWRIRN